MTSKVNCRRFLAISYLASFAITSATSLPWAVAAEDWLQWRGPNRDSQAASTPSWPNSLAAEHLVEQWRVPLGPSYSGPIVVGDRVFTTETREKQSEFVFAFDRRSGDEIWSASWPGAMQVPFFANANGSWIRATPACDGKRLFVAGMRDVLVCLDVASGDELWRVDFVQRYGTPLPGFGFASSPLVVGQHVYVQAAQSLVKLDASSGETVWRSAVDTASGYNSPFSSPTIGTLAGREQILLQTRTALKGIDPISGDELWSQDIQAFRGMNILTPTVYQDSVFTSAHSGRAQLWRVANPTGQPGAVNELWSSKAQAYMSSPVVIGDHLYLHLKNQRLSCLN
ncbi:MAG: PQQ-binding-like beta-propeller repeat protein [Bythopirellula sp.]